MQLCERGYVYACVYVQEVSDDAKGKWKSGTGVVTQVMQGSAATMERSHVSLSNDVAFGAGAAGYVHSCTPACLCSYAHR